MKSNDNMINWFEISVNDLARATAFYETVFNIDMEAAEMMGMNMAFFPNDHVENQVSGALVKSKEHVPSSDGVKIYMNGNPDLAVPLSKVVAANGKIIMPKTHISDEVGYMAFFMDTEGNVLALHSTS